MDITITPTTQLQRKDNIFLNEIDNEAVMLDEDSGSYIGLNEIAYSIWQQLAEPITFQALVDKLLEEYDVDAERCATETRALVVDLLKNKLAKVV